MSGAFSTAKPACSTLPYCSLPTLPMRPSTSRRCAGCPDHRGGAHVEQVRTTSASRFFTLMPPTRSAAFSLSASQRAAVLLARCLERTPRRRAPRVDEGIGMDGDERSVAICARAPSGTKKSASRVSIAHAGLRVDALAQGQRAMASTTSLSRRPAGAGGADPRRRGGVERDHDQAGRSCPSGGDGRHRLRRRRLLRWRGRPAAGSGLNGRALDAADEFAGARPARPWRPAARALLCPRSAQQGRALHWGRGRTPCGAGRPPPASA